MRQVRKVGFEEGLVRLYREFPEAYAIRRETCHCPLHTLMLSFRLPQIGDAYDKLLARRRYQSCGFYCPTCDFSNAGSRPSDFVLGDDVP